MAHRRGRTVPSGWRRSSTRASCGTGGTGVLWQLLKRACRPRELLARNRQPAGSRLPAACCPNGSSRPACLASHVVHALLAVCQVAQGEQHQIFHQPEVVVGARPAPHPEGGERQVGDACGGRGRAAAVRFSNDEARAPGHPRTQVVCVGRQPAHVLSSTTVYRNAATPHPPSRKAILSCSMILEGSMRLPPSLPSLASACCSLCASLAACTALEEGVVGICGAGAVQGQRRAHGRAGIRQSRHLAKHGRRERPRQQNGRPISPRSPAKPLPSPRPTTARPAPPRTTHPPLQASGR